MNLTAAQRRSLAWVGLALGLALVLWLLAPVLTPFVVAAVLAYALHPVVEALAARRWPRLAAVVLVEVLAVVAGLALLLLILPVLAKEIPLLKAQVPALLDTLNQGLAPLLASFGISFNLDVASLKAWLVQVMDVNMEDWLGTALKSVRIGGSVLLSLIGNAVLIPVALFYLLLDWPQLVERARGMIPPRFVPVVDGFLGECDEVLGQYFRGQLLVMVLLAAYYAIALKLAGFDLAVPIGVFTGLAIAVPYLGFGVGLMLAILAALLQFGNLVGLLWVVGIFGLGQVVESLFLTPRLVGERIGLSPLAVIFALMAFGQLFGFVGVLVALPASAVAVVALRRARTAWLGSRLFND